MRRTLCKSRIHRATLTGARLDTYVMEGQRGSGTIQLDGAAARLGMPGDLVIVISDADYEPHELPAFAPRVVFVDAQNRRVMPRSDAELAEGVHEA